MTARVLADLTLSVHMAFILFVVLGGLLAVRWGWVAWLHLPAAAWGALISVMGWRCPLTPLEIRFRERAGQSGYEESFIEHYLVGIVYPPGIGERGWIVIGVLVVFVNLLVYVWVLRRRGWGRGGSRLGGSSDGSHQRTGDSP